MYDDWQAEHLLPSRTLDRLCCPIACYKYVEGRPVCNLVLLLSAVAAASVLLITQQVSCKHDAPSSCANTSICALMDMTMSIRLLVSNIFVRLYV